MRLPPRERDQPHTHPQPAHSRPNLPASTTRARKAADAAIGATEQALIEMGRKHRRDIRLVHPAHTTMDCTSSFGTCLHLHRLRSRVPQ